MFHTVKKLLATEDLQLLPGIIEVDHKSYGTNHLPERNKPGQVQQTAFEKVTRVVGDSCMTRPDLRQHRLHAYASTLR